MTKFPLLYHEIRYIIEDNFQPPEPSHSYPASVNTKGECKTRNGYIKPPNIDDFYLPEEPQNDAENPAVHLTERKIHAPVPTIPEIPREIIAQGTFNAFIKWSLDEDGLLIIDGKGAMPNWNTFKYDADRMGYSTATCACHKLEGFIKKIEIKNGIAKIGAFAFADFTSLTSVTIPNSVTEIGTFAFAQCTSLTSVTIPNSVTEIGRFAFFSCEGLTSITIPDSVTVIGDEAFANCTSLTRVTIANSRTLIGEKAFRNSPYSSNLLPKIIAQGTIDGFGQWTLDEDGVLTIDGKGPMPNWGDVKNTADGEYYSTAPWASHKWEDSINRVEIKNGITRIGDCAFRYCRKLKTITIPDSVTVIGEFAFSECTSLSSVTIPNSVTWIEYRAFGGCSRLKSVTMSRRFELPALLKYNYLLHANAAHWGFFQFYYGIPKRIVTFV